jgi:hypothetical protein
MCNNLKCYQSDENVSEIKIAHKKENNNNKNQNYPYLFEINNKIESNKISLGLEKNFIPLKS